MAETAVKPLRTAAQSFLRLATFQYPRQLHLTVDILLRP